MTLLLLLACVDAGSETSGKESLAPDSTGIDTAASGEIPTLPGEVAEIRLAAGWAGVDCARFLDSDGSGLGRVACVEAATLMGNTPIPMEAPDEWQTLDVSSLVACGNAPSGWACILPVDPDPAVWEDANTAMNTPAGQMSPAVGYTDGYCGWSAASEGLVCRTPSSIEPSILGAQDVVGLAETACGLCVLARTGTTACENDVAQGQDDCSSIEDGVYQDVFGDSPYSPLCALSADGVAACTGGMGGCDGNLCDVHLPDPPDLSFTAISASGHAACGLTVDGTVSCWVDDADYWDQDQSWLETEDLNRGLTYRGLALSGLYGNYLYLVDTDGNLHLRRPPDESYCGGNGCGPRQTFWDFYGVPEPEE